MEVVGRDEAEMLMVVVVTAVKGGTYEAEGEGREDDEEGDERAKAGARKRGKVKSGECILRLSRVEIGPVEEDISLKRESRVDLNESISDCQTALLPECLFFP